ncbi:uncharacterized [Tachysurus ichikawai]
MVSSFLKHIIEIITFLLLPSQLSKEAASLLKTHVLAVLYALLPACLSLVLTKSLLFSDFPCFKPVFDFALANETAVGEKTDGRKLQQLFPR